jgi:hypothetical protein
MILHSDSQFFGETYVLFFFPLQTFYPRELIPLFSGRLALSGKPLPKTFMNRTQKRKLLRPRTKATPPLAPPTMDQLRSSPYMFYHGEPHEKDPKEVRDASPFRKSDMSQAIKKADELFTGGLCKTAMEELRKRQDRHRAVVRADVFTNPKSLNLAAVQRRFAEAIADTIPVTIIPLESKSSFKSKSSPSSPVSPPASGPSPAESAFNQISSPTKPLDAGGPQIPVTKIIEVLRNDFDINNSNLFEALTAALPGPSIGFFSWMAQLDAVLNNPLHSMTTRLACFRVFDVDQVRVLTSKGIRSLRCLKPHQLAENTDGANFFMLKAMLDLFCHPDSQWTSTLTQEDFIPLLDLDENLVQGFLEEIVRQLLVQKYDMARSELLAVAPKSQTQ